jgi:hypothetical protein
MFDCYNRTSRRWRKAMPRQCGRLVPSLKLSSANVGALQLPEFCKELEMMERTKCNEGVALRVRAAQAELKRMEQAQTAMISGWGKR